MPGSAPYQGPRKNGRPTSAPASVRVPSNPFRKRNTPKYTRSASPRRPVRPTSSPRPSSAPGRIKYSVVRPKTAKAKPKKKGPGRFMRGLVTGLALLSGTRLAQGPRNQVRMGGLPSRPPETRLMRYTGHRQVVFAAPGVYNVPVLPSRVVNEPILGYKAVLGSLERKLMPGRIIGKNLAKAKPVYLSHGKYGAVLVGFKPGITPEQAHFLMSRGYRFSNKNLQSNVMHARLVEPNAGLINKQTQKMLALAQLNGKTGLNAYAGPLRHRIRGLGNKILGFGAIVPQGGQKSLPK